MAPHGTATPDCFRSSADSTSGMRWTNHRLTNADNRPIPKTAAYSSASTEPVMTQAERSSAAKQPRCMKALSRERKRPRTGAGTSAVSHGNQAPAENPRSKLKQNKAAMSSPSRVGMERPGSSGRTAMQKVKNVRAPHPERRKRLYPTRCRNRAASSCRMLSSGVSAAIVPSTKDEAPSDLAKRITGAPSTIWNETALKKLKPLTFRAPGG